ncbi:MAG TPA: hypothetical protein VEI57_15085 [Nitrospirota bacterium]|nr:hypothetical protein [Nitrospirota bacterium]
MVAVPQGRDGASVVFTSGATTATQQVTFESASVAVTDTGAAVRRSGMRHQNRDQDYRADKKNQREKAEFCSVHIKVSL